MNNINWKLRLTNKTTLAALAAAFVTFVFAVLGALGVVPSITEEQVLNGITALLSLLCALGIVVDPTTDGITDSEQAMTYKTNKVD